MLLVAVTVFSLCILFFNPSGVGVFSVALISFLLWKGGREKQVVNPYHLFLVTPVSLLFYNSGVSEFYLPPLSGNVQLLIVAGNASFLVGLSLVSSPPGTTTIQAAPRYSFSAILFLGIFPHILAVLRTGLPLLSADVDAARASYAIPFFGQFALFLPITILIAFERRNINLIILATFLNFFFSIMTVSKFSILFTTLFFLYSYARYDGKSLFKIRPWQIGFAVLFLVPIMFEFVFASRIGNDQSIYQWRQELNFSWKPLDTFGDFTYLPYIYLTSSWSNFSYLFEVQPEWTYGARALHSIAAVFQLDSFLEIPQREIRHFAFNTHAYLADFYLDFDIFGIIFAPFVLGLIVKRVYVSSQKSTCTMKIGIWLGFAFATFNLSFSNHFTGVGYPVTMFVLFTAYRYVRKFVASLPRN